MTTRDSLVAERAGIGMVRLTGDRVAHEFLVAALHRYRPGDAVLSEEGVDDLDRLASDRVWIVDPLDGTNDYSRPHSAEWAVHVALTVGGRPVAGAVSLPVLGEVYATEPAPIRPTVEREQPLVLVSRSRANFDGYRLGAALDAQIGTIGSAGVKAMLVVRGEADVYAHGGGLYEWDTCAPEAVAAAAGLFVSTAAGAPIDYNHPDPWVPGFVVCRPELADQVIAALA